VAAPMVHAEKVSSRIAHAVSAEPLVGQRRKLGADFCVQAQSVLLVLLRLCLLAWRRASEEAWAERGGLACGVKRCWLYLAQRFLKLLEGQQGSALLRLVVRAWKAVPVLRPVAVGDAWPKLHGPPMLRHGVISVSGLDTLLRRRERAACIAECMMLWRCAVRISRAENDSALLGQAAAAVAEQAVATEQEVRCLGQEALEVQQSQTKLEDRLRRSTKDFETCVTCATCATCARGRIRAARPSHWACWIAECAGSEGRSLLIEWKTFYASLSLTRLVLHAWRWRAYTDILCRGFAAEAVAVDTAHVCSCILAHWSTFLHRKRTRRRVEHVCLSSDSVKRSLLARASLRAWMECCWGRFTPLLTLQPPASWLSASEHQEWFKQQRQRRRQRQEQQRPS